MTLQQIAKALCGTVNGEWINLRGPGHGSQDRSLGIKFDEGAPDGFRVHSLAGDDLGVCRAHVIALLSGTAISTIESTGELKADQGRTERVRAALRIWNESVAPHGTLLTKYLAARRCPLTAQLVDGSALRFHPQCPFGANRLPAMLALIRDIGTGEPVGIHRTALRDDGSGKRVMPEGIPQKMMLGTASNAAVMLEPSAAVMGIAEGIETALSARRIFGIPVWALLSASGISTCPIIPGVGRLIIFADHDKVGLEAAYKCAERYSRAGIDGDIRYPSIVGEDWNSYSGKEPIDD